MAALIGLGIAGPGAAEGAVTPCPTVTAGAVPVTTTDPAVTAGAVPVTTTQPLAPAPTTAPTPGPTTDPASSPQAACGEPAVGEPPAAPVVTDPTVPDPTITDPAATEPAVTDPTVPDPTITDPAATETAVTDPAAVDPLAQQPADPQAAPLATTDPTASASTTSGPTTAEAQPAPSSAPTTGTASEVPDSQGTGDDLSVLDGQGTGDDVPVLETLPALPSLPAVSPTSTAAPTLPTVPAPSSVAVAISGWTNPTIGRLTSAFGPRIHPVLGAAGTHAGQDIAARCGSPVYAAASGEVVWAGGALQGRTGNQVVIAHGDGVLTRYGHLLTGTVLVRQGDTVQAGQRIASVGGDRALDPLGAGNSTGCHLHFEVNLANGASPVDPLAFLASRGVRLGSDQPVVVVAPVDVAVLDIAAPQATDAQLTTWRTPLQPGFETLLEGRLPVVAVRTVG